MNKHCDLDYILKILIRTRSGKKSGCSRNLSSLERENEIREERVEVCSDSIGIIIFPIRSSRITLDNTDEIESVVSSNA